MFWGLPILFHVKSVVPLTGYLEGEGPHHGARSLWTQSGGIQEESTNNQSDVIPLHSRLSILLNPGLPP